MVLGNGKDSLAQLGKAVAVGYILQCRAVLFIICPTNTKLMGIRL